MSGWLDRLLAIQGPLLYVLVGVTGSGAVLLGYLAGDSYAAIEQTVRRDAALVVAAIAVVALVVWQIRRRRGGRNDDA